MEAGRTEAPSNERVARMVGGVAGAGVALGAHGAMAANPLAAPAAQSALGFTVVVKWLGLGAFAGALVSAGAAQVLPSGTSTTPAESAGPVGTTATAAVPVEPRPEAPAAEQPEAPSVDRTPQQGSGASHGSTGSSQRSAPAAVVNAEASERAEASSPAPAPAPSGISPDTHALREEVAALALAKAALNRGAAAEALAIVRSYRIRFPQGRLEPEAAYIEMEALYSSGNQKRARELAERLAPGTTPNAVRARAILKGNHP